MQRVHIDSAAVVEAQGMTVLMGGRPALLEVSFRIRDGERVALVGPNGAGKTTLLRTIAGMLEPASGTITVHDHSPGRRLCVAYLPQRSEVDWTFPLTVADVVMMGRVGQIGFLRRPGAADRARVAECLAEVGLSDLAGRRIANLSGGQQQRMFFARALAQEAELFLMDEPLTGLDVRAQQDVLEIMERLADQKVTLIVATHDLNVAAANFDRVMLLNRAVVAFGPAGEVLTVPQLTRTFGGHIHVITSDSGRILLGGTWCPDEDLASAARALATEFPRA